MNTKGIAMRRRPPESVEVHYLHQPCSDPESENDEKRSRICRKFGRSMVRSLRD